MDKLKKLQDLVNLEKEPSLVLYEKLEQLTDTIQGIGAEVKESREILLDKKKLKELLTPVYGVDYLTETDIDRISAEILAKATPVKGIDYKDGDKGDKGEDGKNGLNGINGLDGLDGENGKDGKDGVNGKDGKDGKDGETPDHEWLGTKLRFKKANGDWGRWVDLKGKDGKGVSIFGGGGGIFAEKALTVGRIPFTTTDHKLTDDADLSFSGDTLYATKVATSIIKTDTTTPTDLTITTGAEKTLVLGTPVWDDLRTPVYSTTRGGTKDPDFLVYKTNGAGSQGVFVYFFSPTTEQELYFAIQMPHGWNGTAISPHVHWIPKTSADGNPVGQRVEWGLEYTWQGTGATFGNTSIIYTTSILPNDAELVADKNYMSVFADITPSATQAGISSMVLCRIFRNSTGLNDTFEGDAGLLEIDFHYSMNKIGSRTAGGY